MLQHDPVVQLRTALQPVFTRYEKRLAAVYLFGSLAGESHDSTSDVDIAVLALRAENESIGELRFSLYADFSRALKRNDIDILMLNTSGNLILCEDIVRHAILLFEGDADARFDFERSIIHDAIDFRAQRLRVMGC